MATLKHLTKSRNQEITWTVVTKHAAGGGSSKYKEHWDEMRVFFPKVRNTGEYMSITPKVLEALGNPDYVLLLKNEPFVGIIPSTASNEDAFKVLKTTDKTPTYGRMARISCSGFLKNDAPSFPYTVYFDATKEGEVIYFDMNAPRQL